MASLSKETMSLSHYLISCLRNCLETKIVFEMFWIFFFCFLVSADLPDPVVKMLYESDGQNDWLIGEGRETCSFNYLISAFNTTTFYTNSSLGWDDMPIISLRGDIRKKRRVSPSYPTRSKSVIRMIDFFACETRTRTW